MNLEHSFRRRAAAVLWAVLLLTLIVGCITSTPAVEESVAPSSPTASPTTPLVVPVGNSYDDRSDPVGLLASYYNAINRQEYRRAWEYWDNPPVSSYDDFVHGYAETASVFLVVSPPTFFEGAAGSAYTSIPTMLIATHLDGSRHVFVGCYVTRRANIAPDIDEGWSLYSATIAASPGNSTDAALLAQACAAQ